jgi:hypothetical protein
MEDTVTPMIAELPRRRRALLGSTEFNKSLIWGALWRTKISLSNVYALAADGQCYVNTVVYQERYIVLPCDSMQLSSS